MSKAFTVEVQGLAELAETLKALPAEIASKRGGPLARALRKAADVFRDDARERAPERDTTVGDETFPPGRLKRAIVTRRDPRPKDVTERMLVTVRNGRSRTDPRGAFYWKFVEFGTIGKQSPDQEAQPFMRPAFDSNATQAIDTFKQEFAEQVNKAAKKAAKQGWKRG